MSSMPQWNSYLNTPRNFSLEAFLEPEAFYGPVYSWVWNAPLDEQTIRSQIDEMTQAGIQAFYIIPEPPEFRPETMITTMSPPYLSPEFFRLIRLAVEYGRQKGMLVWIYDEGGWPSGNACGQLVKRRPDLAGKRIAVRNVTLAPNEAYIPGELAVAAFQDRTRIAAGTVFPQGTVLREYYRLISATGSISPKAPVLPDLLEPETIPLFIEMTHKQYYDALKDLAEAVVPFVFIDEPQTPMPAFPWDFSDLFWQTYGYHIEDYLYVLLEEENLNKQEAQARQDYADLIAKLHVDRFMNPIRTWCRQHNMIFTGHLDRDHALDQFRGLYGNPLPLLRQLDMPGIDVIWRQIYPEAQPVAEGESFFPRISASIASQTGHLMTLSESFAIYGQNITPETIRWVCNYQFVRGIQIINFMSISSGRDGWLSYGARPCFCPTMPGYAHLTQVNRHISRISYFSSCGIPTTDCALYLPSELLWKDKETADAAILAYHNLGEALEEQGITFDIIDREGIRQGQVQDGALQSGLASYHKIYIPEGITPPDDVVSVLEQLDGITQSLAAADHPDLKLRVRKAEDGSLYIMVFCQSLEPVTGTITVKTGLPCWQADAADGTIKLLALAADTQHQLTVTLEPGQELLILAAKKTDLSATPEILTVSHKTMVCSYEAQLHSCQKIMQLTLNSQGAYRDETVQELTAAQDFASMAGKDFSGEIAYDFTVNLSAEDLHKKAVLTLNRLEHSARVLVNGSFVGYIALKPYRLTLPSALLLPGNNRLTLEVANTASNAYAVTDPHQWFDFAHIGPYNDREQVMERERQDGGLYGPVTVEIYQ